MMHFGIDYGSKMAGTTVITYNQDNVLYQRSSVKNGDADAFILDCVTELQPGQIYIDAPLSLPLACFGKGTDFFYREADRKLKAMSPMFLGGLTARAMKLRLQLTEMELQLTFCN
jgi:predicted nuclease with RNAse H fold